MSERRIRRWIAVVELENGSERKFSIKRSRTVQSTNTATDHAMALYPYWKTIDVSPVLPTEAPFS